MDIVCVQLGRLAGLIDSLWEAQRLPGGIWPMAVMETDPRRGVAGGPRAVAALNVGQAAIDSQKSWSVLYV